MPRSLKAPGQLGQGEKVALPLLSLVHSTEEAHQVGLVVDVPQKLDAALVPCPEAQVLQIGQEGGAVGLSRPGRPLQGSIKISLRGGGAELCQPVGGEGVHWGAEDGDEGHVLPGVVHNLEEGQGHRDLCGGEKVSAPVGLPGQVPLPQGPGVVVKHRARRAHQDYHVGGLQGPSSPLPVGHGEALGQQRCDAPGGEPGLLEIPLGPLRPLLPAGEVQGVQLQGAASVLRLREGGAGVQRLVGSVIHLAEAGGHDAAEEVVDPLQHLGPGAEVFGEDHPPRLPRRGLLIGPEGAVFLQKDAGVCQPEAVDRLLHVPHHE